MTGEVMFSKRFGFLDQGQDIGNSIKNNFFLALYLTLTVYAQWLHTTILGNPLLRWLDFHPKEYTFNTTLKAIAARKENPETRADMMEQWMRQQARHPDRMTEHDVLCAAIANLGAASETVGSVLQAFFLPFAQGRSPSSAKAPRGNRHRRCGRTAVSRRLERRGAQAAVSSSLRMIHCIFI